MNSGQRPTPRIGAVLNGAYTELALGQKIAKFTL